MNLQNKMLGREYKTPIPTGELSKLILKIKSTGEYGIFGGFKLDNKGKRVVVEILDSQFLQTKDTKLVFPEELEVLDPQPY